MSESDSSCCSGQSASTGGSIDPVCGMTVDPSTAAATAQHDGVTYAFCSTGCHDKFVADPGRYLGPREEPEPDPNDRRVYICPMCPGVSQIGPGTCPKCGMALEPRDAAADEGENPELADMRRRFIVALVFTVPLFILSMGDMLPSAPVSRVVPHGIGGWIQLILATPVVLWCGLPFFQRAWSSLRTMQFNMFTLIGMGTGVAYLYSLAALLAPGLFPDSAKAADGMVHVYFEASAVIIALVLMGQVLELRARGKTSDAIRALLHLAPDTAIRVEDGGDAEVPLDAIQPGDRLRVRPGDRVPTDGEIVEGHSAIDEAMLTGESMPVERGVGDTVTGGTVNTTGSFVMKAGAVGNDTVLARIVSMVAEAQRSRAPIQGVADAVSGYFVPAVVTVAVVTFAAWLAVGPDPRVANAVISAVAVLIIACPCALGLATPMSIMVGVGRGAQTGVLIRNAEALETLGHVKTLLVDKTGTLTEGRPEVNTLHTDEGVSESDLLRFTAALERSSEHPLAAAIVRRADQGSAVPLSAESVEATPGQGIRGTVEGREVIVGSARYVKGLDIDVEALADAAAASQDDAETVVMVAIDGKAAGFFGIRDRIKETTREALEHLHDEGVRVVMITGDNQHTAEAVARELGIDAVEAEVLPENKTDAVRRYRKDGAVVAMAGDGINDAPALAAADVGIAMGTGTDVAMESAEVTLVRGDLRGIARAVRLSRATMRNIRQNLFLAFVYNGVAIPIAAGALYPMFGLLLSPMIGAAAMSLSSVSVISNALRLRHTKL